MTCLQCGEQAASYPCNSCGYNPLVSLAPLDVESLNEATEQSEPTPREVELEQKIKQLNSRIFSLKSNHVNLFIPALLTLLFGFGSIIVSVLALEGIIDGTEFPIGSIVFGGIITFMGILSVVFSSNEAF